MSGTSLDGIDVADVDVDTQNGRAAVRLRHFLTVPFGSALRKCLAESLPPNDAVASCVAELNFALGEAFASAVLSAAQAWGLDLRPVDVIGSHGQTLYHAATEGVTLQIGEPAVIAQRTGITCVADFRVADMALGGQGAPLVPYFDREIFGNKNEYRAALNVGGIANVTLLPPGQTNGPIRALDCGPGNMLIDACMQIATRGEESFDKDGATAAGGSVSAAFLETLLAEPYYAQSGPKSTGRERFGAGYAASVWERGQELGLHDADIMATVTALTAQTVAAQIPRGCARVIVSGGGAHNPTLLAMLRSALAQNGMTAVVELSDTHGVPADAKEAMAFALLACRAIAGEINHLPGATGARYEAVLGKVVPGANFSRLMKKVWAAPLA